MTAEELKRIFSRNLKNVMDSCGKTQKDIVDNLNFRQATVSDWLNGKKYPRMDKVEMLAKYFNVPITALIQRSNDVILTDAEQQLVEKYRQLDDDGRAEVDIIIDAKLQVQKAKSKDTRGKAI